jgi:hypothetical protein
LGGFVFAIVGGVVAGLASGDLGDQHSVADHISGALLAFRSGGH